MKNLKLDWIIWIGIEILLVIISIGLLITYPCMLEHWGISFLIFLGISIIAFVFTAISVPENMTSDKPLRNLIK